MFVSKKPLTKFAVIAALASLALAPACKKDGEESGGGGANSAGGKAAKAALNYMPKDSKLVFGVNVASANKAKVLEKYRDQVKQQAPKEFQELEAACGINFYSDITSITVGMVKQERLLFVVNGNFDQKKVEDCMTKMAEKENEKITMADEGKLRTYVTDEDPDEKLYAYWPGGGTVVVSPNDTGGKALLEPVANGEKLGDGEVMKLIKSTKTGSTFWAAGDIAGIEPSAASQGVNGIAATVNATDKLDIKMLANFSSDAKAKEVSGQLAAMIGMASGHPMAAPFKDIIEKFKYEADGKALKAGISLTAADIDKIAETAKQMGGAGMLPF